MSDPVCGWCNIPISSTSDHTILSCKHIYHAHCLPRSYTKTFSHCVICTKGESKTTLYESELRVLDFGNNAFYSNKRKIYEEKLQIIAPLDLSNFPFRVDAERLKQGISKSKSGKKSFFDVMVSLPEALRVRHDDIGPLLDINTSSISLVKDKNVDAESLWRRGVTIERLMKCGYNINDLIIFRATWYDITQMKFTAMDWKNNKDKLPPEDMIKVFDLTIHDILPICNYNLIQFAKINFRVEELRRLDATADILFNIPKMDKEVFFGFELGMEDWRNLGLKFEHMKKIRIEKADLRTMKWTDQERESAQLKTFASLFGKSPDLLPRPRRQAEIKKEKTIQTSPSTDSNSVVEDHNHETKKAESKTNYLTF